MAGATALERDVRVVSTVQSVERALALLHAVARGPAGLVDVAREADLPTSTAARLLTTLEGVGAVERDDEGWYRIGPAIATLAAGSDPVLNLPSLAQPHLAELADELDEAVGLSIRSGRDALQVAQVAAPQPIQVVDWTGSRVPLHAGCAGLAILATWPDLAVDDYLAGELTAPTPATVTDPDAIRARLARIRDERAVWSRDESAEDVTSVGVAIHNAAGDAVGALHAFGPSYRYPPDGQAERIGRLVLACADRISMLLGHASPGL